MTHENNQPPLPELSAAERSKVEVSIKITEILGKYGGIDAILDELQRSEREEQVEIITRLLALIYSHGSRDTV